MGPPTIHERYLYKPAVDYEGYLRSVLDRLPPEVLAGLGSIVLRDTASITSDEGARPLAGGASLYEASGVYYQAHGRNAARIELFVDTIRDGWPRWSKWTPILRYEIVGDVFFHELGHHVHYMENPRAKVSDKEEKATAIGTKLFSQYFRARYRFLIPFLRIAKGVHDLASGISRYPISESESTRSPPSTENGQSARSGRD